MKSKFLFTILLLIAASQLYAFSDTTSTKKVKTTCNTYQLASFGEYAMGRPFDLPFFNNKKHFLYADFHFYNFSNSINTEITHAFLFNRHITEDMKERSFKKLQKHVGYEDELGGHLQYVQRFESKKKEGNGWMFTAGYQYRNMRFLRFNDDAFRFVFAGNKQFEGDTINMDDLIVDNSAASQYQLGLLRYVTKGSNQFYGGATLAFLHGPQHTGIKLTNSYIYTAPLGEYLDVRYNLQFHQSNVGAPDFFSPKGVGFAGDVYAGMIHSKDNHLQYYFRFSATDLGFMKWRKETTIYTGDSAVHFEGIVIDNMLSYTTPNLFKNFNEDSLFRILNIRKQTNKPYITTLPMTFSLSFGHSILKNKGMINAGVIYKLLPGYYPFAWTKFSYCLPHGFIPSVSAGFGGYSIWNLGLELSKAFPFGVFTVGSQSLPGLIAPKQFTSSSLYARLGVTF